MTQLTSHNPPWGWCARGKYVALLVILVALSFAVPLSLALKSVGPAVLIVFATMLLVCACACTELSKDGAANDAQGRLYSELRQATSFSIM